MVSVLVIGRLDIEARAGVRVVADFDAALPLLTSVAAAVVTDRATELRLRQAAPDLPVGDSVDAAFALARLRRRLVCAEAVRELVTGAWGLSNLREVLALVGETLSQAIHFDVAEVLAVPDDGGPAAMHLVRRSPCDVGTLLALHPRCAAELIDAGRRVPHLDLIAREMTGDGGDGPARPLGAEMHVPIGWPGRTAGMITLGTFDGPLDDVDREAATSVAAAAAEILARAGEQRRISLMVGAMTPRVTEPRPDAHRRPRPADGPLRCPRSSDIRPASSARTSPPRAELSCDLLDIPYSRRIP